VYAQSGADSRGWRLVLAIDSPSGLSMPPRRLALVAGQVASRPCHQIHIRVPSPHPGLKVIFSPFTHSFAMGYFMAPHPGLKKKGYNITRNGNKYPGTKHPAPSNKHLVPGQPVAGSISILKMRELCWIYVSPGL
jgi:hypothetical protein